MNLTIQYGDQKLLCQVSEKPALDRKIRIHVFPDGCVEVEAPVGHDKEELQHAAQKRARWIFEQRQQAIEARALVTPREYVSGETHFYLGRRHQLVVKRSSQDSSSVRLLRGKLEIRLPVIDPAAVKRRLNNWYQDRAFDYFGRKVIEWANVLPWMSTPPTFKLARMSTQWGTCSPQGIIQLNLALIRAPRHCIDYVVLHELCHLKEHNHSRRFYELLDTHMPMWRLAKGELDHMAELLLME